MAKLEGIGKQVFEKAEWVAIATAGPDGPHLVATWGEHVRALGMSGDKLLIPADCFYHTEENLQRDDHIELLAVSTQVAGSKGPGQGVSVVGHGQVLTSGPEAEQARSRFPWARGALVVTVDEVRMQW